MSVLPAASKVPTGPIAGHRWSSDPITHKLVADGACRSLKVRTGFFRLFFILLLSIWSFLLLGIAFRDPWLALVLAPFVALGLTMLILRFYRSLFWEVTIDTARGVVELRRGRLGEVIPLAGVVGFQICECIDRKSTGFVRYHNEFHQLILVYESGGEIHRRLILATTCKGPIVRLMDRLRRDVKIDVTEYAAQPLVHKVPRLDSVPK